MQTMPFVWTPTAVADIVKAANVRQETIPCGSPIPKTRLHDQSLGFQRGRNLNPNVAALFTFRHIPSFHALHSATALFCQR